LLTSEFLQEPRGNFRQDGAQLILLGYHDASRSRFLRSAFGMTRLAVVDFLLPASQTCFLTTLSFRNGALCREESAVLDPVPTASKSRFLRSAFGMTKLAVLSCDPRIDDCHLNV
jgi:hypothetical protein